MIIIIELIREQNVAALKAKPAEKDKRLEIAPCL
jgi:hypothetical protein